MLCSLTLLRRTLGYFGNVNSTSLYDIWESAEYKGLQANYMEERAVPRLQHEAPSGLMKERWRKYRISEDASHHVYRGRPAYPSRFHEVLKFHEPGLAPVRDSSGAIPHHPRRFGSAYKPRHIRTFGFYEGRAAVHSEDGWFHILSDGEPYVQGALLRGAATSRRVAVLSGCPAAATFILKTMALPAYGEHYRYAGDFKDGYAVVQREDGKHTHIDTSGNRLHGQWLQDLDVFHKRYARACDSDGWHHVDMIGKPLYGERFKNVEPFYNGQARVEGFDGSLSVIDESGQTLLELRGPSQSHLEGLSADMVGLWRTQTIHSAVELGVFECPARVGGGGRAIRPGCIDRLGRD